jgi:hypothetical protein
VKGFAGCGSPASWRAVLFVQTPRDLRAEFFATDLSDYVTGVVIPIDDGLVRG